MTAASPCRWKPPAGWRATDYFQNPCEWFSIDQPHNHLEVLAESRVTVEPAPERLSRDSLPWEQVRALLETSAGR